MREVVVRREKELEALTHRHHADQEKLINTTKQVSLALVVRGTMARDGGCLQTCQCMLFAQPFTGVFICFVFVSSRSTRSHLFSGGLTTTTIARFSW